ncbi:MAG: hypothetical protein NTX05_03515, partial [Fusobacteria bacterium]|nr:hypothetical protein [Fusobacteriota bacterium]
MKKWFVMSCVIVEALLFFGCGLANTTKTNAPNVLPTTPEIFIVQNILKSQVANFYLESNTPFNQGSLGDCMGEAFVGATG